jgi:hypothetical protein
VDAGTLTLMLENIAKSPNLSFKKKTIKAKFSLKSGLKITTEFN